MNFFETENPEVAGSNKVKKPKKQRVKSASTLQAVNATKKTQKEPTFLARMANQWWNRLLTSIYSGNISEQSEQYAAHSTSKDYIWNSVGWGAWGAMFPLLTIVATQIVGVEQAGMFSMAFVIANLLWFLGNYGVRTYQVSDLDEQHSFTDYNINRVITCLIMLVVGYLWCEIKGYPQEMTKVCYGVFIFRMIDAYADVFEGRLQQMDKLYLAGISMTVRSALSTIAFSVFLILTRSLEVAGIAMAIGATASLLILTIPLTLFETPKSRKPSFKAIKEIFINCFPLFCALFLYALIDAMPKFAMENVLSYDNQLYFNTMYFPSHAIIMIAGIIYKPQLVRLATVWQDKSKHKRFDLIIWAMIGMIAAITAIVAVIMVWIGIPVMSFLYGVDFAKFKSLVVVMVVSGGVCASIDFLYQIITVLRAQQAVTKLYLIAFAFSVPVSMLLIGFAGLAGAVIDNLIIMAILFVLLVTEYFAIRKRLSK